MVILRTRRYGFCAKLVQRELRPERAPPCLLPKDSNNRRYNMNARPTQLPRATPWRSLPCPRTELRLDLVLCGGQTFRWSETSPGYWTGVLAGRVWTLTQSEEHLWYTLHEEEKEDGGRDEEGLSEPALKKSRKQTQPEPNRPGTSERSGSHLSGELARAIDGLTPSQILQDYFQLHVNVSALYQGWSYVDSHFREIGVKFPGVRVLRQDPVECLFSFICTSNNHLSRITNMIQHLCQTFGRRLCQLDTKTYHAFPSLQAMAGADTEARLRDLGFGYRARFISESARAVMKTLGGAAGLQQLRTVPYEQARHALCTLPGVGVKEISSAAFGDHILDGHKHSIYQERSSQDGGSWLKLSPVSQMKIDGVLFCADLRKNQESPDPNAKHRCIKVAQSSHSTLT
ncbi:hypothetical protein E2320_014777 [Naja naja]|nr:hypothetical protein E2320_014777 [Naja naja]